MSHFLRREDGNATILVAGIIAALAGLAFVIAALGAAQIDTHRAQLAADLAAVAGAFAHAYGENGCAEAGWVTEINTAVLADCGVDGADLVVTARVGGAEVSARAGPI